MFSLPGLFEAETKDNNQKVRTYCNGNKVYTLSTV